MNHGEILERYGNYRKNALEYMRVNRYGGHDDLHIIRVERLSDILSDGIGLDYVALMFSVWFHDLERKTEAEKGGDHALLSAEMAYSVLSAIELFSDERIKRITDAIASHRYRNGIKPRTIEGMILQDADRLDALGCIGILRVFVHNPNRAFYHLEDPFCEGGRQLDDEMYALDHFYNKLFKLEETFNTKKAKLIAGERIARMKKFLDELKKEIR